MEAARIAAARGHEVTLYEKGGSLGGLLDFAKQRQRPAREPGGLQGILGKAVGAERVNVVLNHEVDAAFIDAEKPDAVILAAGGLRDSPCGQGRERSGHRLHAVHDHGNGRKRGRVRVECPGVRLRAVADGA